MKKDYDGPLYAPWWKVELGKMNSPFNPVKNTRETYNRFLEKVITEVQVQFDNENPAWIPLETLLAIKKTNYES